MQNITSIVEPGDMLHVATETASAGLRDLTYSEVADLIPHTDPAWLAFTNLLAENEVADMRALIEVEHP